MSHVPLFILDSSNPSPSDSAAGYGGGHDWKVMDVALYRGHNAKDQTLSAIREATVIIADVATSSRITLSLLGIAAGLGKSIVGLSQGHDRGSLALEPVSTVHYGPKDSGEDLWRKLYPPVLHLHEGLRIKKTDIDRNLPPLVFVSYCHADRAYLDRLHVHLRPIERESNIQVWSDLQLRVGVEWKSEIEAALSRARVAILLVSADFIASDFIANNELPPLLSAAQSGGTQIFSLILSASRFEREARLSKYQAVNDPRRPIDSLPNSERESVLADLAYQVERALHSS